MVQPDPKIFVVIPAWNEEANIGQVLDKFLPYSYQVVVVDDGSVDQTSAIVARHQGIFLVKHFINRGMGAALQTGNSFALSKGAEIIVHFDADGQMQVEDIAAMIQPLLAGEVDISLGSRFLGKYSNIPWTKKYLIQPVARIINYIFTKLWLSDVHNGFRAMTSATAKKLTIRQDGMAHNTEIPAGIKRNKLRYVEIPVTIIYNEFGQGVGGGFKILRDLIVKKFSNH